MQMNTSMKVWLSVSFVILTALCLGSWQWATRHGVVVVTTHGHGIDDKDNAAAVLPPGEVFNVRDYGAVGDGVTKDTKAVEAAIAAVEAQGSGTVYFGAGHYLVGSFNLTNNIILFLDAKAVLIASEDPADFPILPPLPSYGDTRDNDRVNRHASLIHGQHLTNVTISGTGKIDARGRIWWDMKLRVNGAAKMSNYRPTVIELLWSSDIEIRNITIVNSPFWTVHPTYCDRVLIDGITIINPPDSPNTDGVDVDSSTNVVITNNYISCGDDNIAIKSGYNEFGRSYNRPSANIYVANNVFEKGSGMAIGSEMSGGVYNVTFANNHCEQTLRVVRLKAGNQRGGELINITYVNNTGHDLNKAILIDMTYDSVKNAEQTFPPIVKNFVIENLVVTKTIKVGAFLCLPDLPCEITLKNVVINGIKKSGWECIHSRANSTNVTPTLPTGCLSNKKSSV